MKRAGKILTAALILFSTLFLFGCDLLGNLVSEIIPKDEWYVFDKEFEYSDGKKMMVQVWAFYSDTGYTHKSMRTDVTIGKGLTFVVLPDVENANPSASEIQSVFGDVASGVNPVAIKTFAPGEPISAATENVTVNDKLWLAIYLTYIGKNAEAYDEGCPTALSKHTANAYTLVGEDFSWSTFLKQIVVANVIDNI
ncbi:MAG: hypothetical protein MJ188_08265 [Treponema sp.]|nr:hypothetical protein [Treponema sp.]